jgi:hypothetical protein
MSLLAAKLTEAGLLARPKEITFSEKLPGRTAAELLASTPPNIDWIIPGVLGRGWSLKVAGREKVGKGNLIANLLGCVERGEETLFGPATAPCTAVILTEEPEDSIREKIAAARLEHATVIYGWELARVAPSWDEKVAWITEIARRCGAGIVFVDNISRACGAEDEAGTELARSAEKLIDALKAHGIATVLDHHHRKAAGKTEDKSRGGTGLPGAMDCNLEIERFGDWDSRVRKLSSRGRVSATIWARQIALSEDGQRYESVTEDGEPQRADTRRRLRLLQEAGDGGLTAAELANLSDLSVEQCRRVLRDLVADGRATVDDGRPKRYHAVPESKVVPL